MYQLDRRGMSFEQSHRLMQEMLTPICSAFIGACVGLVIAISNVLSQPTESYQLLEYPAFFATIGVVWGSYQAIQNWRDKSTHQQPHMDGIE